ncbi:MAG TPA: N-acetyl-gamma-glutamyl-phosphate reductase, partial [Actinomycetota bacterium]|nr:N-acetyl-gamma-glutamyl-phosphate reductase [Actinomycetota bacterium]
ALSQWAYGLTEQNRESIATASKVANPGCYSTAALLALGPLAKAGVLQPADVVISAVSGISGAGRAGGEGFDFSSANENARAYSVVGHKHIPEIEQQLDALSSGSWRLTFVPHLIPMTRGVLTTCFAEAAPGVSEGDLVDVMNAAYHDELFVTLAASPETRRLAGTNQAEVGIRFDERTNKVVAIGAIDNLGKGAAGQAVQNANLMLGIEESLGLTTLGMYP